MAGDDGKVYLFGYFDNDDAAAAADVRTLSKQFLIDGRFDVNRDGVISAKDDRFDDDDTPNLEDLTLMRKSLTVGSTSYGKQTRTIRRVTPTDEVIDESG